MLFKIVASGVFAAVPLGSDALTGDTVLVGAEAVKAAGVEEKLPANLPQDRIVGVFTVAPTGGYSLKILGVEEQGDSLVIKAELVPPEGVAIQVITRPWVLILLEKPLENKRVRLELAR